jgi:hypothetical protein
MGCLVRALRYSRVMYPQLSIEWVFPAESSSGHMSEQREERSELSKWGNDLRQSYRTLATVAGLSEIDAKLLMNHAIPGVNSGYITRHKLLEDHLRAQQQAISSVIFATVKPQILKIEALSGWLGAGVARRATAVLTPQFQVSGQTSNDGGLGIAKHIRKSAAG